MAVVVVAASRKALAVARSVGLILIVRVKRWRELVIVLYELFSLLCLFWIFEFQI